MENVLGYEQIQALQEDGFLGFLIGGFLEVPYHIVSLFINFDQWLPWLWGLETLEDKQSLMRFVYYGASQELFFVVLTIFLGLTIWGMLKPSVLWKMTVGLETFANSLGRFTAWAGLLMVLQQIIIVFMQSVFAAPTITIGLGTALQLDIAWWSEHLRFYNAMIVCLCAAYTFVQGGHVRVDLVYAPISFHAKKIVDMIGSLIFMAPMAILTWLYGWFFLWRSFIVPNPAAANDLDRLLMRARALRWNVEYTSTNPSGFNAYFLFKVLLITFAALILLQAMAMFWRSYLEWCEGEESEQKYIDRDRLGDDVDPAEVVSH